MRISRTDLYHASVRQFSITIAPPKCLPNLKPVQPLQASLREKVAMYAGSCTGLNSVSLHCCTVVLFESSHFVHAISVGVKARFLRHEFLFHLEHLGLKPILAWHTRWSSTGLEKWRLYCSGS